MYDVWLEKLKHVGKTLAQMEFLHKNTESDFLSLANDIKILLAWMKPETKDVR